MKSINQVTLLGNLGKEPEIKQAAGTNVAKFTLATSTGGYKKQDGSEVPERTTWHTVIAWKNLADLAAKMHKGDRILVIGSISNRDYESNGMKHNVTEIVANDIFFCGGKTSPSQASDPFSSDGNLPY